MATLTGKLISNTYKDLLQVSNGNDGVDSTVRFVSDGEGTNSALKISNSEVETTGKLTVGANLSASGKIIGNSATVIAAVCASTYFGDGSNLTGIVASAATSVLSFTANQLTVVSGAAFTGKVSGTAAEFSGVVSAGTFAGVAGIFTGKVSGTTLAMTGAVSASTFSGTAATFSGNVTAASYYGDGSNLTGVEASTATSVVAFTANQLTVVSGASFTGKVSGTAAEFSGNVSAANLYASTNVFVGGTAVPTASDIAAVSALTSVNAVNIAAVSALTSVNLAAITSVNTRVTNTSAALATSIGNSNTNIAAVSVLTSLNLAAITSVNTRVTNTSTALATSIGNSNTNIAAVSVLTSVNKAAITSINAVITGDISADSGIFNTLVVKTSASVSGELRVGSKIGVNKATPLKQIHISKSAVADINALTDGTNISVDLNAGQNFTVTLAGNRTLDNPTNCVAGQVGSIFVVQDGTGSQTLGYGTSYDFAGGTAPTLSTAANAIDRLDYIVHTSTDVHMVLTNAYS
tara:strand:- start:49 stop:1611 length:1563 start_codon:yes stop_codon:yes gene_type:complete